MMDHKQPIYFIGIGGIGMSALARYYLTQGHSVGGYDRTPTPITHELERLGCFISYKDDNETIPPPFRTPQTLVIYTPAIPANNSIKQWYEEKSIEMIKRSEALGRITKDLKALCVAGTHGKTTTSTILAHLMYSTPKGVNAFLGGLSLNHSSNLILAQDSPYVVVEADEYDRSFHRLTPYFSIITSVDPDHLDIYGDAEGVREAFSHYTSLIRSGGGLFIHDSIDLPLRVGSEVAVWRYGKNDTSDFYYTNLTYEEGELYFDYHFPNGVYKRMHIGTPIEINVLNATAALAVAQQCGASEEELRRGLSTFKGVHRRFERVLSDPKGTILIDDYAHHPDEIEASLHSLRSLYPDKRITIVFQPHLYSRTSDFKEAFAERLSKCDELILLDIYPAREEPIPGVSSASILEYIPSSATLDRQLSSKSELLSILKNNPPEVLVMMGAGDIEFLVPQVRELFEGKNH